MRAVLSFALAAAAASDCAAAGAEPALSACVVQENPPFSFEPGRAERPGIDAEAAALIARELGRELRLVWVLVPERGGLGRALKESIQAGRCDFFMGVPGSEELRAELAQRHLGASQPYLEIGYRWVSAPGTGPATLAQARRAARVGVATATPADLYLLREHFNRYAYGSNRDLIEALRRGEVDLALVWSPALAQAPQAGRQAPVLAAEQPSDPGLRTSLAVASRDADAGLQRAIDAAIGRLVAGGSLARLERDYQLPVIAAPGGSTP